MHIKWKKFDSLSAVYKDALVFLAFSAIFFLWGFQSFYIRKFDGLDPSWILALNWIDSLGIQWGKDIAFTYGPLYKILGFWVPFFYSRKQFLIFHLLLNVLIVTIKSCLLLAIIKTGNTKSKLPVLLICFMSLLLFNNNSDIMHNLTVELMLVFSYVCFVFEITAERKNRVVTTFINIIIGFIFSISLLSKFGYFYIVCVVLAIMCIAYMFLKKAYATIILLLSFLCSIILLWITAGQSLYYLPNWILSSISISGGYTEAMRIKFNDPIFNFNVFIFALLILLIFAIIVAIFLKKKIWVRFLGLFLVAPQLFLLFKEAFVRSDTVHVPVFLFTWPIILCYCLYIFCIPCKYVMKEDHHDITNKSYRRISIICACFLFINMQFLGTKIIPNNKSYYVIDAFNDYQKIADKESLRKKYDNFAELDKYISKETDVVDIIPWDISLLYAYEYNWMPRYTLQSYTNYTSRLDKITAEHLLKETAPNKIIYSLKTIDNRYAIFDEPATFQTILLNYSVIAGNNDYLILEKKETSVEFESIIIDSIKADVNKAIYVPQHEEDYIFAEFNWEPTLFGRFMNLLYKSPQNSIIITLKDGTVKEHTFIRDVSSNGLLVSKYVSSINDFSNMLESDFISDIDSVTIKSNPLFYNNEFNVSFVYVSEAIAN